jgi:hypothetical protein
MFTSIKKTKHKQNVIQEQNQIISHITTNASVELLSLPLSSLL